MSFDDLAFSGLEAKATGPVGAPIKIACSDCKHDVTVPRARAVRSAFSGLWSVRCPDCGRLLPLPADLQSALNTERKVPDAGANGDDDDGGAGAHGLGAAAAAAAAPAGMLGGNGEHLMALLQHLSVAAPEFVDFGADFGGASANNNMADMIRAQRGVDVDALMQRLLNSTEHSNIPPTADAFMKAIKPQVVTVRDCIQPLVVLEAVAPNAAGGPKVVTREFACTTADGFGLALVDAHDPKGDAVQLHAAAPVVAADPIEGAGATNTSAFKGAFVVMRRGKIAFGDKARVALNAGAKGLVVLQLDDPAAPWPYTMTDAAKTAADIKSLPCVMLSAKDGAVVLAAAQAKPVPVTAATATAPAPASASAAAAAGAGAGAAAAKPAVVDTKSADATGAAAATDFSSLSLTAAPLNTALSAASGGAVVRVVTRVRGLACSVCRDDFEAGKSEAVKLPCNHFYCEGCIKPWLLKRNTCPLCRFELPTDKPKPKTGPPPVNPAVLQLRENMFS